MANNTQVGNSGIFVSDLILGTALTIGTELVNQREVDRLISCSFDESVTTFDSASNYGDGNAERMLGTALQRFERQNFVLMTKAGWPVDRDRNNHGMGRKNVFHSVEKSLNHLKVDYIDILFSHRFVDGVSIEELITSMNILIQQRKILHWGTSQWPDGALLECIGLCEKLGLEKPVVEQSIYSYIIRDIDTNGVRQLCEKNKIGVMGFSPLAQGLLTGKYRNSIPSDSRVAKSEKLSYDKTHKILNQKRDAIERFLQICDFHNVNPISAALQFSRKNGVIPIMGCTSQQQLKNNVEMNCREVPIEFWEALLNDDHVSF